MSGVIDEKLKTSNLIKEVMEMFDVDEETAGRIIRFSNKLCLEKFEKWLHNSEINRQRMKEIKIR